MTLSIGAAATGYTGYGVHIPIFLAGDKRGT